MEGVGTPEAIDTVMKLGMNHPMGPLALADFIGLDTCLAILEVLHDGLGDPKYRPCPLLRKYVAAGWLGRKTERGFYSVLAMTALTHCHRLSVHRLPNMSWALIPLTEEQREIQRTAREFARAEIAPHSRRVGSATRTSSRRIVAKLGALGFLGMLIPEEYDGLGLDTLTYLVALEEIAAVDASVAVLHERAQLAADADDPALRQRRAEGALPQADGARRDARRVRAVRARGRVRRGVAAHAGRARRRLTGC